MARHLKMKCSGCGHWNRVEVKKIFFEQDTLGSKVKAYIPMYAPFQVSKCVKCGKVTAEPNELIRIMRA